MLEQHGGMTSPRDPATLERSFESSQLYRAIYDHVEEYVSRYDMSHDFKHVLRVLALAKHILAQETEANPGKKLDKQAITVAALLHDVGDRKYLQPGENANKMINDLLAENCCSPSFITKVSLIIENVSYSNEIKQPALVNAVMASHPELAVVQDADRLDAIGAVGIARCFAFGAAKATDCGLEGSVEHFIDKLEELENMMKTETGRRLARERTQRLKQFRQWWEDENALLS